MEKRATTPVEVRAQLTDALRLDLVGPGEVLGDDGRVLGDANEILLQRPSTWYLTGFLVPLEAGPEQKIDEQSSDEVDGVSDGQGLDDAVAPKPAAARVRYLPSSIGASLLVPADTRRLKIIVRWGDYKARLAREDELGPFVWNRLGCEQGVEVRDQAFAFQAQLEIHGDRPFVPRPNLRSLESSDWDERVADLQYRDACEFAVGHSVATEALINDGHECWLVRTRWLPQADVARVAPAAIQGVELSMDALGQFADAAEAEAKLGAFVTQYREWINRQRRNLPASPPRRRETAEELLNRANVAANRIEQGIVLLADPQVLEAFRIANRAMASAARQRLGVLQGKDPSSVQPGWRPSQLAFLLMNLPGTVDPHHDDREVVDLLFFPTGGGKTEAYLGLAAFILVMRRLKHPGIASAGSSVLMRDTLRLLTLDQLGRAATLMCALELERQGDVDAFGPRPFEIGLWVGKAATPNVMGKKGDGNNDSARARPIAFKNDDRKPSPIPLENYPWCGTKSKAASFQLLPNPDFPTDLRVTCVNRRCAFTPDNPLPILAVDALCSYEADGR